MTSCPSSESLEQFLSGRLAGPVGDALRAHLALCSHCQAALDRHTDNAELRRWADRARQLPAAATEEGLARLLHQLRSGPRCTAAKPPPVPTDIRAWLGPAARPGDLGTLGPYRLEAEVGRGGMGLVFRAFDETLLRTVAVKVLRPERDDPAARARLVREAQFASRFRHDHVVAVHAVVDPPEGLPYLIMEYVPGPSLDALVRQRGGLPPVEAAELICQVADALAAAHAAGLVHRDIKPGNILIDPITGRARLTDFGLARLATDTADPTRTGALAGTPAYMSPEQVRGAAGLDGRTDVYSLGMALYEALTGAVPFRGTPGRVLEQVLHEEPQPPRRLDEAIPRDLETVCLKAQAKEPPRRYQTAGELADDLRRFLRGEPVKARPAGPLERGWRWGRRNPRVAGLATALAVVFVTGFAGVVWQWQRADRNARAAELKSEEAERRRAEADENFRLAQEAVRRCATLAGENRLLNMGEYFQNPKEAEQGLAYQKAALAVWEQLTEKYPNTLSYQEDLGKSLLNLGAGYLGVGDTVQAEDAVRKAATILGPLARAHPAHLEYQRLARNTRATLGFCYQRLGRYTEAEAVYREVLHDCERLAGEHPQDANLATDLGGAQLSLGMLLADQGEAEAALAWYGKALATLQAQGQGPTGLPVARFPLLVLYQYRVLTLLELGRTAEAAADWERAVPLDFGFCRHYFAFYRGLLAARRTGQDQTAVYQENYEEAVAELERFQGYLFGSNAYFVAAVCSQASAAAARDDRLTPARRQQRAEQYATRALHYLAQARQMGYFRAAGHRQLLRQNREFDPLRSRPAFQELLTSVTSTP